MAIAKTGQARSSVVLPIASDGRRWWVWTAQKAWKLIGDVRRRTHLRLFLAHLLLSPVPLPLARKIRPLAYRWIGFTVGKGVLILGNITFDAYGDLYSRLTIGNGCAINTPFYLNLSSPVKIGNRVGIGHHVNVMTDTHDIGPSYARLGPRRSWPVTIEDGAWICAGCIILPGVTIGRGSVVSAGSVVTRDVPPNAMVAGNPARVVSRLPAGLPSSSASGENIGLVGARGEQLAESR